MFHERWLLPEDFAPGEPFYTAAGLRQGREPVVRGRVIRCDQDHRLTVRLGEVNGVIPAGEAVAPFISGAERDIAVLSCVGRCVCCAVTGERQAPNGDTEFLLSRRRAQELAMDRLEQLEPGSVLRARVTQLAPFGAFVDVGCGVISLVPLAAMAVARTRHPGERFRRGQHVYVAVRRIDAGERRLYLSHRELLGSWLDNAALFWPGDTVAGISRGATPYGVFVELTPNLVGLADLTEDPPPEGHRVSVTVRAIQPERQKVKLRLVQDLGPAHFPTPLRYFTTGGTVMPS